MVTTYHVKNLDCANCALKIENHLRKVKGIKNASVNFGTLTLTVDTDTPEIVRSEVRKVEPDVQILPLSQSNLYPDKDNAFKPNRELLVLGISSAIFIIILLFENSLKVTWYLQYTLVIIAYLLAGWNILRNAVRTILRGTLFDENVLMTIATLGAIGIHALSEAVGVMIFYKLGEFFQSLAVDRSRRSIRSLLAVRPHTAHVQRNGSIVDILPDEVSVGEIVLVKPGERIPLDGEVVEGISQIDTSALTGEAVPQSVSSGSTVLAGEINLNGLLSFKVMKPFAQSSIARVIELVENAVTRKAKTERFITKIARFYTPAIVGAALLLALVPPLILPDHDFRMWIYRALVLLVISCPCALVISIPLGYFGGIGGASRRGVLVKGANYLDLLAKVKTVVFDKTGTLTEGVFKVRSIMVQEAFTESELIYFAACAEHHSNHPIAHCIRQEAAVRSITIDPSTIGKHEEKPGGGVAVEVNGRLVVVGNKLYVSSFVKSNIDEHSDFGTVIHVAVNAQYAGYILVGDEIKPTAQDAIKQLRKLGVTQVYMLTGDNQENADAVGKRIGIDRVYASLLPQDKVTIFEQIEREKHHDGSVAFVGDGINDAPVLARADVGIAMGTLGSDAAIETADVVITGDSPDRVVDAIRVGRATRAIVWQNIIFAVAVKVLFITFGAFGLATMWEAVFADMGTAVIAVFNSSRALRIK